MIPACAPPNPPGGKRSIMNHHFHRLSCAFTTALLGSTLLAQVPVPVNPPPWWRTQDNVTVSLAWDFSGPAPLTPTLVVAPPWYNPAVTQAAPSGPLQIIPVLNGHTDVLGIAGNGTPRSARLDLTVDNDPHLNWIKIFWFQFDEFEGASGSVVEAIRQDLGKYKRSSVTTKSTSLGGGWNRVTVSAQLIPQPDDEGIDFAFTEAAFGSAAIDNLFVNSKCVKVSDSDQDGDAFGEPAGSAPIDLTQQTGATRCLAAAVTEGPGPAFPRTYWVSALASSLPGATHQVFQLNSAGFPIGTTTLPDTLAAAPNGASDLAVETVAGGGGTSFQVVYALVDLRTTPGGNVLLRAIDTNGVLNAARTVVLTGFPPVPPQQFGLAFNPHGNQGTGTFLVTAPQTGLPSGHAYEFDRAGNLLRTATNLPLGVVGAGYDEIFGNYYWFSNQPQATPTGLVQTNGAEWSAYDFEPTGTTFYGNLQLPNPGGSRGGEASGLEVYRRANGQFHAVCVVQIAAQNRSYLYELKGPFRFGPSLLGTCGMQGLPFAGSNNFAVTLAGVPSATFAMLYAGFSRQQVPFSLAQFGLDETNVLIGLDMNSTLQLPTAPGEFAFTLPPLPAGFANVPMFFQWVIFDPVVPGGVSMSKAGKTLIY